MRVAYFRRRRPGPELEIEDAIAEEILGLFQTRQYQVWVAGSIRVGAGLPDLIAIEFRPQALKLAGISPNAVEILAFLRSVGLADSLQISSHTHLELHLVETILETLRELDLVTSRDRHFSLPAPVQDILPRIVAIEAKVKKWKSAVRQAARNCIFAHESYVALPEPVANQVTHKHILEQHGLGLLSVSSSLEVSVCRNASSQRPNVWAYYYGLAAVVAQHFQGARDELPYAA